MPSLIPGFEYDIFISYRHNDNRSGWVTEFVKSLQEEISGAIKEPVSVYFDVNPHDGLLETHSVDKSLEGKLKSLIFIPILSQTYSDPKSFAWQHEFCSFNKSAAGDQFGRDIKLKGGNVASRILPIRIHDLDDEDKNRIQSELGSMLRSIDFIYRSSGVVRPLLRNEEDAKGNLDHTFYRDQVNKVVRTIKDLITSMQAPMVAHKEQKSIEEPTIAPVTRKRIAFIAAALILFGLVTFSFFYFGGYGEKLDLEPDRSIAVLPFDNMNKDPEQDYFSNGIAEDILNHLVKVSDLKVKSRTSTLKYKGTDKTIPEIAQELGVANIVEGSVRKVGDKVRIVVQLIDAKSDVHLWSETYDRDLKDVLSVQSEIAMKIANALQTRLTAKEKESIEKEAAQNATAYDYFLKAKEFYDRGNGDRRDMENALLLVNKALQLDSTFTRALALKGTLWFEIGTFGISQKVWQDSALYYSGKAIKLDASEPYGYIIRANIHRYLGQLEQAEIDLQKAYEIAPNTPAVQEAYGYLLLRKGDANGADLVMNSIENQFSLKDPQYFMAMSDVYYFAGDMTTQEELIKQSKLLNPGAMASYFQLNVLYQRQHQYEKALIELKQAEKINPNHQLIADQLGWLYYRMNDFPNAIKYWSKYPEIEASFDDTTQIVPFRHRLAMVYGKVGRKKEGDVLVKEDMKIQQDLLSGKRGMGSWGNLGSIYYDLAVDEAYVGNHAQAVQHLDSAFHYNFNYRDGYDNDPVFAGMKQRDDFRRVAAKVNNRYAFIGEAFSKSVSKRDASKDLKLLQNR